MSLLEGIRVLDLSRVIAGPYCAAFLADLGADVVKVERPPLGDDLRVLRGKNGMSASFAAINRNKRGIALDLQHPEGAKIAFELATRAEVVTTMAPRRLVIKAGRPSIEHHRSCTELWRTQA